MESDITRVRATSYYTIHEEHLLELGLGYNQEKQQGRIDPLD